MRSHAFAPPLYLFVFAAFVRRQVTPPDCRGAGLSGPRTWAGWIPVTSTGMRERSAVRCSL
ncbi:hypothetical protein GHJ82_17185 [Sinorhizobium saheli]|nr:hypothetical protein [Sinorhizobium saheli]